MGEWGRLRAALFNSTRSACVMPARHFGTQSQLIAPPTVWSRTRRTVPKIRHVLSGRAGMRVFGDHVVELQDGGAPLDKTNVMLRCGSCAQRARRMAL